jgi:CheY-like chemotaxis protein
VADLLLVDSHPLVRRGIGEILRRAGHRVEDVGDGGTAIEWLQHRSFDLLIVDLDLPVADGITVIAAARDLAPTPKIIAMSASIHSVPRGGLQMPIAYGADRFLAKPFSGHDLRAAIEEMLRSGGD